MLSEVGISEALWGIPRVFCCKSAEVIEIKGDDVFSRAKECVRRALQEAGGQAKERGVGEPWRDWVVKVTTKVKIYGE